MSLTLYDLNDRELLYRLDDVADADGGATSEEIARALGLTGVEARNVAQRLSWLRRYGAVEARQAERRDDDGTLMKVKVWHLTDDGERFVFGHMNQRQRASFEKLDDAAMLDLTELMTERYQVLAASTAGNLIRRQWQAGTHRNTTPRGRRRRLR